MKDDKNITRFLLEQKITTLGTVATVSMTWWVSSIVFCGTILAAVWANRKDLFESKVIGYLGLFLSAFFLGIVIFGFLIVLYLRKARREIGRAARSYKKYRLIDEQPKDGKPWQRLRRRATELILGRGHNCGYFSTEINYFIWAVWVGILSFVLVLAFWICLAYGLSKGCWKPTSSEPQPNNGMHPTRDTTAVMSSRGLGGRVMPGVRRHSLTAVLEE